ncbi:SprT family zinc-dependent metalloprotease [Actibacterium sp. MT2.3-13A]|uniref:M48 family metallopeptidase n=1 Tax=Actibacterium sp. MT2.3-13A TaxID=2828332 RepID=UPI001BA9ECF4|nr:SprT family zinc-dependent metalloprotease [Actibacterium sp. MT2.3-13A]
MPTAQLPGAPPVEITLRRSARARRYSLRVSQLDGRVTLTLPRGAPLDEGMAFAREKAGWIRAQLAAQPAVAPVEIGGAVPFEGATLPIVAARRRGVALIGGQLEVPDDPGRVGPRVQVFLKEQARGRLAAASDRHAAALGRDYGRLTLRDTRSRWGSCSSRGDLMYSWRLVMAPPEVLDYVVAHEVAHLAEMNHSPAFWALVERLCPGHRAPRAWLRAHGALLHRVRFGD